MENNINIAPPSQPTPSSKYSFFKKNFTPKFIAVIVGILILGGTAYGYATYLAKRNFNEVSRVAEEGRRQEEELRQKRLADTSDVSDWQTYRNDKYGFEFKYPSNLEVQENKTDAGEDEWRIGDINRREADAWLVFDFIILKANKQDLNTLVKSYFDPREVLKIEVFSSGLFVEFDGLPGSAYFQSYPGKDVAVKFLAGQGYLWSAEFNQILSTFKFIE